MGNELFGVDIAGIIADNIGDGVLDVTVTRMIDGTRDPDNPTAGVPKVPQQFDCKGFWEDYTTQPPPGIELKLGDRKLILIGDTIPVGGIPERGDAATVHETAGDSTLYVVQLQSRDPAAAVYTFQCRDRGIDGPA